MLKFFRKDVRIPDEQVVYTKIQRGYTILVKGKEYPIHDVCHISKTETHVTIL